MAGQFGLGLGLQGEPALHGQWFNQRQQQELARQRDLVKKDDENFQEELKRTSIKPELVDWKLQPLARDLVASYASEVTKARQKNPLGWQSDTYQMKLDVMNKLTNIQASSARIKAVRDSMAKGEIQAPEELARYLDTNQGDLKTGLPSLATQKLYGITIDPNSANIGFNPVKKVNFQDTFQKAIYAQPNAWQDVMENGQPKVFPYKTPNGVTEYRTKRAPGEPFVNSVFETLTADPHFAQNINIEFAKRVKNGQVQGFTEDMIMDQNGNLSQQFLTGAHEFGKNMARNTAANYFTTDQISQPAKTNITVNAGKELARTVSAIGRQTFQVGMEKIPGKPQNYEVETPAQFTTGVFKANTAKSGSVIDLKTNKHIKEPGVDLAEYGQFAVVPVYTGKDERLGEKGAIASEEWNGQKGPGFMERLKKGDIEWKVVGIGSYKEKIKDQYGDDIEVSRSILRDADELIGAAATPLSEPDTKDFKRNIEQLKAEARRLNEQHAQRTSVKPASNTLEGRKGNPNKADELRNKYKY